uniref:Uncharacterized protein n=1 Tax=Rhizophora mucronata TaxID=61149 RepID=A0A2P2Q619_RHIMU
MMESSMKISLLEDPTFGWVHLLFPTEFVIGPEIHSKRTCHFRLPQLDKRIETTHTDYFL